jgi:hypothetical protein
MKRFNNKRNKAKRVNLVWSFPICMVTWYSAKAFLMTSLFDSNEKWQLWTINSNNQQWYHHNITLSNMTITIINNIITNIIKVTNDEYSYYHKNMDQIVIFNRLLISFQTGNQLGESCVQDRISLLLFLFF